MPPASTDERGNAQTASGPASAEGSADSHASSTSDIPTSVDAPSATSTPTDPPSADAAVNPSPTPTPSADPTYVFVAQGHLGRTTVSCDDGQTWIRNRSVDDNARCWDGTPTAIDCDHHQSPGRGVTYSEGWFFATFGWGEVGGVDRSRDGYNWTRVLTGTTFANIAADASTVIGGDHYTRTSPDTGLNWGGGVDTHLGIWNARRIGFAALGSGLFVLTGEVSGGARDVVLSSDRGNSWWHPTTLPAACAGNMMNSGGIAAINGSVVVVDGNGNACVSDDGGQVFTLHSVGGSVGSQLVATPSELIVFGPGVRRSSTDGKVWTSTPLVPSNLNLGAVARSPTGTFAAVNGGWDQWYTKQRFYRSTDGIHWTTLTPGTTTNVGSHPLNHMTVGLLAPGVACP